MPRPPFVRTFPVHVWVVVILLAAGFPAAAVAQQTQPSVTGVVTDTLGVPVVRSRVRLIDGSGAELASTATDDRGRFTFALTAGPCSECRVEATLAGFLTTATGAASGRDIQIQLPAAPVRESVVVAATRGEAPSGLLGSSVTVLDQAEIQRRGSPIVADLLRSSPGAVVVQTGGIGNVTSAFVRGGESDYNKVLLDGIPLNEPGGTFNFGGLTTVGLERVEIVRGPLSALFGSDAMSSVIHLESVKARPGVGVQGGIDVQAGGYGTRRLTGTIGTAVGRWDVSATAGRINTENRVPNNAFDHSVVGATAGGSFDSNETLVLRAVFRIEDQRVGVPGQTSFGRPDLDSYFDRRDTVVGASLTHRPSSTFRQRLSVSHSRSRQQSTNLLEDAPWVPTFGSSVSPFTFFDFTLDNRNTLRRTTTSYQADWTIGAGQSSATQIITAAADIDAQRATLEDRLAGDTLEASRNNFGLTVQHQFIGARTVTTASLRVERNGSFGMAVVPRVSVGHLVSVGNDVVGDTLIRASAGLGIKEPTMLESFSKNFFFLGNPDLEPERSRAVDAGIEQRLFGQRAKIELTWFDSRYRGQIWTETVDFNTFEGRYFNIGLTRARGVELSAELRPVSGLRVRAGHTFLASTIVESMIPTSPVFKVGVWAFRRPRHSGFVDVAATTGRVSVDLSGVFAGRRVDGDFAALDPPLVESNLPTLWTLGLRVGLARSLEGYVRVENLSDVHYMEPLGYEAWRRTAHAGLRLSF